MGVSAAVLVSRILGVVRDSMFSALFGVSALTDAYRIALQIPNLLRDLFAEGALSSAFVPTFSEALMKGGQDRAYRLGNLVMTGVFLVTGMLTLMGIIWAPAVVGLISGGFTGNGAKFADAVLLTRLAMPALWFISVSAVFMGMLNAQRRFSAPALAPAIFNVTAICFGAGIMIVRPSEHQGVVIFCLGVTLAALVQGVCQLPSLWRLGFRPALALQGLWTDPGVRRIVRLMAPAVVGLAAIQVNVFVNTRFACALGDGPATYLGNASRLFYLPIGLFGVALATVTQSRISEEAARGDQPALIARTIEGTRAVWMLAAPSAVGLVVLAEPVVALLFEHGKFSPENTAAAVPVVQAYMIGVLPHSLVKVFAPAFYALDKSRVPMLASISAVTVNVAFNCLTFRTLGAPGLAFGTTLAALVNLAVLRVIYARVVGSPRDGQSNRTVASVVLANAILGMVVAGLWQGGKILLAIPALNTSHLMHVWALAALLFATIAIGFTIYVAILSWLRFPGAEELRELPGRVVAKFHRR